MQASGGGDAAADSSTKTDDKPRYYKNICSTLQPDTAQDSNLLSCYEYT